MLATGCRKKPVSAEPAMTLEQVQGYYQVEKPDADGGHYFVEITPGGLQMGKRSGNAELSTGFKGFVSGKEVRVPVNVSIEAPGIKVQETSTKLLEIRADGTLVDNDGRVYTRATKPPPIDLTPKSEPPLPPLVIGANGLGGEVVFRTLRRQPDDPKGAIYSSPRLLTTQPLIVAALGPGAPRRGWVTWTEPNGWTLWPEAIMPGIGGAKPLTGGGQLLVNADDGPYVCKPGSAARPLPPLLAPPKPAGRPENLYLRPAAASGISRDARVVVGWSKAPGRVEGEARRAVRWVDGKPEPLSELPGTDLFSEAKAVSADGQVITGVCHTGPQMVTAVRWRADGTVERIDPATLPPLGSSLALSEADTLAFPPGIGLAGPPARRKGWVISETGHFKANAVTADGRVMVGQDAYSPSPPRPGDKGGDPRQAMAWIDNGPSLSLNHLLADTLKMDLKGWQLFIATDISADGRMVAGMGFDEQGEHGVWLLTLPANWWEAVPQ
jgi:hypothetical protein